ncbi:MAG: methyltransferase domain-containing protein [Treponema sp.]|nr:methyltransferase domain-containing protein [Treponema sp.]
MSIVIIVPATEKGRGGGHLSRCISLTRDLRNMNKEAFLFMPHQERDLTALYLSLDFNPKWCITNAELKIRKEQLGKTVGFIILDRFQTPLEELLRWKKIAPVIGIDEGGLHRGSFDFLIDILIPEKIGKPKANIISPALLRCSIKNNLHNSSNSMLKVLITFGQEDSAGLGIKTAKQLSALNKQNTMEITLIRGALQGNNSEKPSENVHITALIPKLAERLGEWDVVITHYGITAYEAVFAETPVLLVHPTKYHKKLGRAAGFKTFSVRSILNKKLLPANKLLQNNNLQLSSVNTTLADLCAGFSPQVRRTCPVCGAENSRNIVRFTDRNYRRCSKCGVIYMDRLTKMPIEYEKDYFFESYKNQYGKTYLEDFETIKQAGKRRIKIIKSLRRVPSCSSDEKNELNLLDIGCAYGPFLEAAKEAGFSPVGIDPCEDAVQYVREKLGIPAIHGFFPDSHSPLPAACDVITLWLVIEHFTDCAKVTTEIRKKLKPNGILAFSTPSFSGISGRTNLKRFLSASPADHFVIWSPKVCKKALMFAGFKVRKIVITGHHSERFPLLGKFAKTKKSPLYWILLGVSKLFGLGDTLEVYAQKLSDNPN